MTATGIRLVRARPSQFTLRGLAPIDHSPEAECVTQKRVDVVNVPVLELETLQRPACLEPEVLLGPRHPHIEFLVLSAHDMGQAVRPQRRSLAQSAASRECLQEEQLLEAEGGRAEGSRV